MLSIEQAETTLPEPQIGWLGGAAVLVVWDLPHRLKATPRLDDGSGTPLAPSATVRLALADGGTRIVAGFLRSDNEAARVRLLAGALIASAEIEAWRGSYAALRATQLTDGLTERGKVTLVSSLFGVWSRQFSLGRSRRFAALATEILKTLVPRPTAARSVADLIAGLRLVETRISDGFGAIDAAYVVAPDRVQRIAADAHSGGLDRRRMRSVHIAVAGELRRGDHIAMIGAGGLAVRRVAKAAAGVTLRGWSTDQRQPDGPLREYAIEALCRSGDKGAMAALEYQVAHPLPTLSVRGGGILPAAEVDVALATPAGLLVGGWLHDPASLVAGIELLDAAGERRSVSDRWHRFRGRIASGDATVPASGFAAFVPSAGAPSAILQPRLLLALKSGTRLCMVPRLQPATLTARRAAALRAIPPQHLSDAILADCLHPALASLQQAIKGEIGAPEIVDIGAARRRPEVSVVVPLYKVLDFLKVQIAALAVDRAIHERAEIVFVLDSPEQADTVKHLLDGLHLLYALPMRLVVMERNGGFALACNAGAAASQAPVVLFLNSDVIPTATGWLTALRRRLDRRGNVAACGPKLLFGDGSIQHAGMYFARNAAGRWLNHHFHKGMPRDFPAAGVEQIVPAVTGACLAVRRSVLDAVGDFTDDYCIGDYEDSDLCLKIRRAGFDIAYVPEAELYHLERQSIRESADYSRGVAAQYNAWLHEQRWSGAMQDLMGRRNTGLRHAA